MAMLRNLYRISIH